MGGHSDQPRDQYSRMFFIAFLICAGMSGVMSQGWGLPEIGKCPEIPVMDGFDLPKIYGRWYDVAHNHWLFGEPNIACVTADYTELDGTDFTSTQSEELRVLGTTANMQVQGVCAHSVNPGQFTFWVPGVENPPSDGTSNYNFIETDYDNYACVYECWQVEPELREVLAFALSRDTNGHNKCNDIFEKLEVKHQEMVKTVHDDDCFYFPEP